MNKESYSKPTNYNDRYTFAKTAIELCNKNKTLWDLPEAKLTSQGTAFDLFATNYLLTLNRQLQSPAITAARNAAWSNTEPLLLDLYNSHLLNNEAISISDKKILGITTVTPGGNSPYAAPTTLPLVTLLSEQISVLHVLLSDSATPNSHAKPEGVAFCEMRYKLGSDIPTTVDDCPLHKFISHSREAMVFTPEQRGKVINAYARWVNRNSKTGPWSALFSSVIP